MSVHFYTNRNMSIQCANSLITLLKIPKSANFTDYLIITLLYYTFHSSEDKLCVCMCYRMRIQQLCINIILSRNIMIKQGGPRTRLFFKVCSSHRWYHWKFHWPLTHSGWVGWLVGDGR